MRPRLYCEECDQCYDGQDDPRSDHGHCQDCGGLLSVALLFLQSERIAMWRGYPDEDHE
jgi:hypothetical protein